MKRILMCGSTLDTKGGMVSVAKNYLHYDKWDDVYIKYVPTHFDTNKYLLVFYFCLRYLQIVFLVLCGHFDIAHLHTAERGSFWRKSFLLKFFHRHGVKVVLHHHAAEFEKFYAECSENKKKAIRQTLLAADLNIVLSDRLIPMITDKEPRAKVAVLYNAVSVFSKNPYDSSARNVLFMGRLGVRKGTFDLIEAIKRLDDRIPRDVCFYLCGDMGENLVKKKIEELHLEHRIAHIGWIDGEQKRLFISKSMINCLPSYNEGLPMTILETMAAGLPNISTNIASIPEVVKDGENGFLIEPGDVNALTNSLLNLIQDNEKRMKFSQASYELINKNFSLDANINRLKKIYNSL